MEKNRPVIQSWSDTLLELNELKQKLDDIRRLCLEWDNPCNPTPAGLYLQEISTLVLTEKI